MANTVTLGGAEYSIAPLKALQVAAFFDELETGKDGETKVKVFTRSIRVIAQSLANAKDPVVSSLSESDAMEAVNNTATFEEITPAFLAVLDVSGLKKGTTGEATAAESTGNESSAASPATPDGPSNT
jgi:hypothetical protein